jgi:hypothetical protein
MSEVWADPWMMDVKRKLTIRSSAFSFSVNNRTSVIVIVLLFLLAAHRQSPPAGGGGWWQGDAQDPSVRIYTA